jgi:hypothetical protein
LRGLTPAFSDYSAWLSNASDLLIVATPKGKLPALDLQSLLNAPNAREDLARLGITNTQQLAFRQIADAKVLRAVANMHPTQRVNSDYFPVLGLEAPKARFKGVSADTLLTMSVVNRPLLEALGVGSVLAETVVPPSLPHFVADGLTVRARGYAQELRGNTVDQSTSTVTVLSAVRDCSKTWTMHQQRMLMISLSDLADRTIKYLPPSMLEGVWVRPKWLTCDTLPADVMRALKLFEAHSLRDYPRMAVLGQEWLKNRPQDSQLARLVDGYAWSGILLHAVAEKRWGDLTEVVNRMEESKTIHPEFGFLKAIARGLAQEANR